MREAKREWIWVKRGVVSFVMAGGSGVFRVRTLVYH